MGERTLISWTGKGGHTWNPWQGCRKVSSGCRECYMFRDKKRYGQDPNIVVRSAPGTFSSPLKWHEPALVFSCSWSDWFIEQADPWRADAWDIVRRTPHLTYLLCTKRAERIAECLPKDWGNGWDNVWLGVTVEEQRYALRFDILAQIPCAERFISYEPAVGPLDMHTLAPGLSWLISGGESGGNPRKSDPAWFRAVRDFCAQNEIAYFHKQNGGTQRIDGVAGGNLLDGQLHHEFPAAYYEKVKP